MDDMEDYIKERDKEMAKHYRNIGRIQEKLESIRIRTCKYLQDLSDDAVATPEFIRSFNQEITEIVAKLDGK